MARVKMVILFVKMLTGLVEKQFTQEYG